MALDYGAFHLANSFASEEVAERGSNIDAQPVVEMQRRKRDMAETSHALSQLPGRGGGKRETDNPDIKSRYLKVETSLQHYAMLTSRYTEHPITMEARSSALSG
ncbi:hypothetical protein SUNI508_05147 [Seiridium unicorne]|uniref:Uncharacterized protein n=1 Tax=Seiridium unicorne TaxID=138068 RepID=A0ABR2V5Q9_9PEZI